MLRLPDSYSFQARYVPMLVVVLPALVLLGAGVVGDARLGIATGVALTVISAIFSQLGRDRGKKLEPSLWESWGGAPTLRRLRFSASVDPAGTERLHRRVETELGDSLPTEREERDDPDAADRRYREATRRLAARTTDSSRFRLVFAENVSYGMRRNLLGLRPIGILMAALTLLTGALLLAFASGHLGHRAQRYVPGLGVAALDLLFWLVVVTANWARVPAEAYADRLMESTELLTLSEPT